MKVRAVVKYIAPGRPSPGSATVTETSQRVIVDVAATLNVVESDARPGRFLARCRCFGMLGTGSTPEYAMLDLKRLLEVHLEDLLEDGTLKETLIRHEWTVAIGAEEEEESMGPTLRVRVQTPAAPAR